MNPGFLENLYLIQVARLFLNAGFPIEIQKKFFRHIWMTSEKRDCFDDNLLPDLIQFLHAPGHVYQR